MNVKKTKKFKENRPENYHVHNTDLPRYHSLVEDFGRLADRWMAAGQLRGPVNVGGGYLLDLQIPLSGEEGDVLLGEIARDNEGEMDL